jgi:hypothetical protein
MPFLLPLYGVVLVEISEWSFAALNEFKLSLHIRNTRLPRGILPEIWTGM